MTTDSKGQDDVTSTSTGRPVTASTWSGKSPLEWQQLTSDELALVDRELPVVMPVGLIESHGPALTLGFDNASADYFSRAACSQAPSLLLPTLSYGFADEFRDYPGTLGLSMDTLGQVVADVCGHLAEQGFRKVVVLAGHGADVLAARLGFERVWRIHPQLRLACWTWWQVVNLPIHHADEVETSFALAMGETVHLERARDAHFTKPWHLVRSRQELMPESGGVNGSPTRADAASVAEAHDRIVAELAGRIRAAYEDRREIAAEASA